MSNHGMRLCPFCSETIQSSARKCKHCAEWLTDEDRSSRSPIRVETERPQFVSNEEVQHGHTDEEGHFSVDQQRRLFVGVKYDSYYKHAFAKIEQGKPSLNWAAAFFNAAWTIYRKQYSVGIATYLGVLVVWLAALGLCIRAFGPDVLLSLNFIIAAAAIWLAVFIYFLVNANHRFLRHVDRSIDITKSKFGGLTPRVELGRAGGTSKRYAFLALLLFSQINRIAGAMVIDETSEASVKTSSERVLSGGMDSIQTNGATDDYTFDSYTTDVIATKRAPLQLGSYANGNMYRTTIRQQYTDGQIDFGGHFIVVLWGAGMGQTRGAMVDVLTGNIYALPLTEENSYRNTYHDNNNNIQYRANSTLFVTYASAQNPDNENLVDLVYHYYRWDDSAKTFALLDTKSVTTQRIE